MDDNLLNNYDVVLKLFSRFMVKRVVEVGVFKAKMARYILKKYDVEEYWGVDSFGEDLSIGAYMVMVSCPQFRLVRLPSVKAATVFADGYFDAAYIDAAHDYESVRDDCAAWLPKVRVGGIISGHDYGGKKVGVKRAVDELFGVVDFYVGSGVWYKEVG